MKSDLKGCFLFWLEKKKIGCIQVLVLPTNYSSKSRWPERILETVICRNDTSGITTFWTWPWHMTQQASSFSLSQTSAGICSNTLILLTGFSQDCLTKCLHTPWAQHSPQLPNSGERGQPDGPSTWQLTPAWLPTYEADNTALYYSDIQKIENWTIHPPALSIHISQANKIK